LIYFIILKVKITNYYCWLLFFFFFLLFLFLQYWGLSSGPYPQSIMTGYFPMINYMFSIKKTENILNQLNISYLLSLMF
jgi:hypothetical protein